MEKDLFLPIKTYFEDLGYLCDGEVKDIDLYMEHPEQEICVAVELKQSLDFRAMQQAALRQKVCDAVFIGIFRPKNMRSRSFQDKLYLLKRLGIGLIVVSERTGIPEIVNEPIVCELSAFQRANQKKKKQLAQEFHKRTAKSNTGGVHAVKLITSYREEALLVLDALISLGGVATTRQIRAQSGIEKTTAILYHNYYGWFSRVKTGTYQAAESGYLAIQEFKDTLNKLKNNAQNS